MRGAGGGGEVCSRARLISPALLSEIARDHASWSSSALRMSVATAAGCASCSLKMDSTTCISVAVVSRPQNAHQSLTTMPAPITSEPRFKVPATTGSCSSADSSSWSSTGVFGWTRQPLLDMHAYDPTSALPATVCRKTSTPSTSAMISSVSRSSSVWMSAQWSLHATTLPSADSRSSTRWIRTPSGSELRRWSSSWSVVVLGTTSPFLLPTTTRPTMRVPAMEVCTTGMCSASSCSKTE
mmetsp:Transcript_5787/g.19485  ORF Transcript_5787/g.19485 Transcript_5787/m.19485 type:complete len:240 (-) Transcript_5787:148-867(-)